MVQTLKLHKTLKPCDTSNTCGHSANSPLLTPRLKHYQKTSPLLSFTSVVATATKAICYCCCRAFRCDPNPHSHFYFLKTSTCFTVLIRVMFLVYGFSRHMLWHKQGKCTDQLWLNNNVANEDPSLQRFDTLSQDKYFPVFQRTMVPS